MIANKSCAACGRSLCHVGSLSSRDFDGSIFNFEGHFLHCRFCGFVRVESGLSDSAISRHYAEESLYSTLSGVGVGGQSAQDEARYAFSVKFMEANGCMEGALADIGCSRGGFIRYLHRYLPNIRATGVDCDTLSLASLMADGYDAIEGDVFSLPFESGQKDILCYFHVLEHLYDVDRALIEARRVLKSGGALLIEVPDAEFYFDPATYVGPLFWLGMKEHVNHFTPAALRHFLGRNGFEIVDLIRSAQPMKGGKCYPSLMLLAKQKAVCIDVFIQQSDYSVFPAHFRSEVDKMRRVSVDIANLSSVEPICFWGIGLEFFALYGLISSLLADRKLRLVDRNHGKLGMTIDGLSVDAPDSVPIEGTLVCCSYMADSKIRCEALALGWPENAIRSL
jgi:SAM-dependent methyltransferase